MVACTAHDVRGPTVLISISTWGARAVLALSLRPWTDIWGVQALFLYPPKSLPYKSVLRVIDNDTASSSWNLGRAMVGDQ